MFGKSGGVIEEARNSSVRFAKKLANDSQVDLIQAQTILRVEDFTTLYFPALPHYATATQFVKDFLRALYVINVLDTDFSTRSLTEPSNRNDLPVIRCQVKTRLRGKAPFSVQVIVRSAALAEKILAAAPIQVGGDLLHVNIDQFQQIPYPSAPGSKVRDGLDCPTFEVVALQMGQLSSNDSFKLFWGSHEICTKAQETYKDPINTTDALLQINPVERKLCFTIKRPIYVYASTPDLHSESLPDVQFIRQLRKVRVEVPLNFISGTPLVQQSNSADCSQAICIPLHAPPRIFRKKSAQNIHDDSFWDFSTMNFKREEWVRTIDPSHEKAFTRASAIRFGIRSSDLSSLCNHLRNMGFSVLRRKAQIVKPMLERAPDIERMLSYAAETLNIPFSIRYMVACILSFNQIDPQSLDSVFWSDLCEDLSEQKSLDILGLLYAHLSGNCYDGPYDGEDPSSESEACKDIENTHKLHPLLLRFKQICGTSDSPDICESGHNDEDDFSSSRDATQEFSDTDSVDSEDLIDFEVDETLQMLRDDDFDYSLVHHADRTVEVHERFGLPKKPNTYLGAIRRVLVTPTRIISIPPELDVLNRVLRHFAKHRERFIRVSFCDEDGSSVANISANDDLLAHVRRSVLDGIRVAGEVFVFLAFSNSQLREHGIWMYNQTPSHDSDNPPSADDIRAWMGEFSDIRIPGK